MVDRNTDRQRFEVNGQTYQSLDEVPQPYRDSIASLMADRDGNGVPDIVEAGGTTHHVVHQSSESYDIDGVHYASIDEIPEPQRTAVRDALGRHDSTPPSAHAPARPPTFSQPVPAVRPQAIITPARGSRRARLLAAFIAVDAVVAALIVWLLVR